MSTTIPKKELKMLVKQTKRGLSSYYTKSIGSEVSFINIKDVYGGIVHPETVTRVKIKETGAMEKSRIEQNDVILTVKGSAFKAAVASKEIKGYVISANLVAFTLNDEIIPELVVAYLNSPIGQNELQSRSAGIAQKALNIRSLMEIKIPIPPMSSQIVLSEYLSLSGEYDTLMQHERELRKKINNNLIQNYMQGD